MSILKRIILASLMASVLSILAAIWIYLSNSHSRQMENATVPGVIFFTAGLCLVNFLLSLTALFNHTLYIRDRIYLSALCFIGGPLGILLLFSTIFLQGENVGSDFSVFFIIANPFFLFTCLLIYHFFQFRKGLIDNPHGN